jgi:hypothetical protein
MLLVTGIFMEKEKDRIKKWREKKKAEGKKSCTVVLSVEAQEILAAEKKRTGASYSAIVEKALLSIKKPVLKSHLTHSQKRGETSSNIGKDTIITTSNVTSNQNNVRPTGILIDDLENYSFREESEKKTGYEAGLPILDMKAKEGFINRFLNGKFTRKKRWFK